jgi:hypothetical protein
MNHTKRITQERDRYREMALEMEFRLKQAERRNIEHEDDYLAVWKVIKEPNETLLDACKRIVRERDGLRINAETNREGMAKAQLILDAGRWAGFPLIDACVTELEECRAALKYIHQIVSEKDAEGKDLEVGSTAMKSVLRWASGKLKEENDQGDARRDNASSNS